MIEVQNLSKDYKILERDPGLIGAIKALFKRKYQVKRAVNSVSFTINQGEMVAYIGFNGAGKSTTIKMLCGILTPDDGSVKVNGIIPYKDRVANAKNIGAVFGQRTQLAWDIPVRESFDLLKHIYEVPQTQYDEMLKLFEEVLDLGPLLPIPVRQLSLGQKMRCELAASFLHRPPVVFLDEPTIGLDIDVKAKIREFIKEMNRRLGTTVVLTTHDMQDIEEICSRVIIIDKGIIIYDGSLQELKERFEYNRLLTLEMEEGESFALPHSLTEHVELLEPEETSSNTVTLTFHNKSLSSGFIISEIVKENKILDVSISDPKLETIIKHIYTGRDLRSEKVLGNAEITN